MISTGFSDPLFTPLFMIVPALILVMLMALTMRAVIMRERAMIRQRRQDQGARAAYESRWRDRSAA
jgi:hypothetical protein